MKLSVEQMKELIEDCWEASFSADIASPRTLDEDGMAQARWQIFLSLFHNTTREALERESWKE